MTAEAASAYGQLLSLGVLWISVHCAGMCGPLLCGLDVTGAGAGVGAGRGALRLLLYQAGRALTYAWLGGVAGLVTGGLRRLLQPVGTVLTLALGAALIVLAVRRLLPAPPLRLGRRQGLAARLQRGPARLLQWLLSGPLGGPLGQIDRGHPLRPLILGAVLGLLPCGVPLWVLGLATMTGSPLHGAALMLLLTALTTPVLLLATQVPRLLGVIGGRLVPVLMAVSGVWMILIGCASLGWIDHARFGFTLLGRGLMVMFF